MQQPNNLLSYPDAAVLVQREAAAFLPLAGGETLPLLEARGRVLADAVTADRDQPPFPRATRDGFAARAAEWQHGALRVHGLLRAGAPPSKEPLPSGCCVEIMTGAAVPADADCVVMVEHTDREEDAVRLHAGRSIAAGANLVPTGAEAQAGDVLLAAGTRLQARGIAAAAACGYAQVRVHSRPRVAILATGDELVDVAQAPQLHQIRNSNTYSLAAGVSAAGGEPVLLLPAPDEARALETAILQATRHCDLLLLSGGVSMGRYDLVEPALEALGARFHFTGVRMQPGKPVVFGSMRDGELPFFGLPGNPVSTMVCFALFVAPVLAALCGEQNYRLPLANALLSTKYRNDAALTRFLPARLSSAGWRAEVAPVPWQGSGDLAAAAQANCFAVIPEKAELAAGDDVAVLLA